MKLTLLQAVSIADDSASLPETTTESTRLIDIVSGVGPIGIVVLAVIFVLSVIAVYIFFERYFKIKKAAAIDPQFMDNIKDYVVNGNIAAARDLCLRTDSPVARMVEKGVNRIGRSLKDINSSIENTGNLEIYKLEKGLNVLATISGAAPMLGFFGTVTGMISVFHKLSQSDSINLNEFSGGIFEAMLTTAFGLFVGIIAYIGYNTLVNMVQKVIFKMEASSTEFVDLLQEPSK
jgi:biopolymer transport protein ExbB